MIEGLLKVTGIHVHYKIGDVLEMVQYCPVIVSDVWSIK